MLYLALSALRQTQSEGQHLNLSLKFSTRLSACLNKSFLNDDTGFIAKTSVRPKIEMRVDYLAKGEF